MNRLLLPLQPYSQRRVVAGVSGGADSVALLRALVLSGAEVVVAHLDHALREDSAQDAAFVRRLAEQLGLPFFTARIDVGAVAHRRGWNVEDAARRLRYDFLTRTARQAGASAVLTAHTQRDQAETVLTRVLRGEAVLGGIAPQVGRVERPWLGVSRAEIEQFLGELGQAWREDPTNADPHYNRAWLRTAVMPTLQARYPALEPSLARLSEWQAQDDSVLQQLAQRIGPHTPLAGQPLPVLRRWAALQLEKAGFRYHFDHLEALAQALAGGRTLHLTLPEGHAVSVTGGQLYTAPRPYKRPDFQYPPYWDLRHRQPGDRIRLPGGQRKLSDLLTDLHVPRAERDAVYLLAQGEAVQWIGLPTPLWAEGAREQLPSPPAEDPLQVAMRRALALAKAAAWAQEVPVGAVILNEKGQVIAEGRNTSRQHSDMTRHAELQALRAATQVVGPYLSRCTLVVTLEPCPMCLGAALEARLGRIVYGASNPKAGALGGVYDLLGHHWGHLPEVQGGVMASQAAYLLRQAFQEVRRSHGPSTSSASVASSKSSR